MTPQPRDLLARRHARRRPRLRDVVLDALAGIEQTRLDLDIPGADEARALQARLLAQLRNHLIPRLTEVDAPALVVFGGSTGAGKSTLVNSLVGTEITPAGVLRPTTREPVLLVHPEDRSPVAAHPIAAHARIVEHPDVPVGLALMDTPDLDSVDDANRALGAELVEAADLWVFVTTANRYGDALPWATLRQARERGVTTVVVLNRVGAHALVEVRADLLERMVGAGVGDSPLFVLPDLGPHEGLIPRDRLADLDQWLEVLAERTQGAVVARTIRGSWPSLRTDLGSLADAVAAQDAALERLGREAREIAEVTAARVEHEVTSGALVEGEIRTRWLAVASTGGPLGRMVAGRRPTGRGAAERATAAVVVRDGVLAAVRGAVVDGAGRAEREIRKHWGRQGAGGAQLLASLAPTTARPERVRDLLEDWVAGIEPGPLPGRAGRLLRGEGWAALACAAAVGLDGAAKLLDTYLGERGPELKLEAARRLTGTARAVVLGEADPFTAELVGRSQEEVALGLRVRASELRGVL